MDTHHYKQNNPNPFPETELSDQSSSMKQHQKIREFFLKKKKGFHHKTTQEKNTTQENQGKKKRDIKRIEIMKLD
jgi:hypothetical protein